MMHVPKRLLDDHAGDSSVRELIAEASRETGPAIAKAKTLAALGLVGGAVTAAGTASAGTAGAFGGGTTAGTATAVGTSSVGITLKIAVGVVVTGIVASTAALAVRAPVSSMNAPVSSIAPPLASSHADSPVATAPASPSSDVPVARVEALPPAELPRSGSPVSSSARRAPPPAVAATAPGSATQEAASGQLVEEAAALERARRELVAGRSTSALAVLDGYDQRFPRGELQPEATALRVEALAASGNRPSAHALGAAFLAVHSRHPAAARVRRVLGETTP